MTTRLRLDLNADLGEGGADDAAILTYVSSANIACGGHAGDLQTMHTAVKLAAAAGVKIGAHPSYPDRANFGRSEMTMPAAALADCLLQQIQALAEVCQQQGQRLHHIKPHGALYNRAGRDPALAELIVGVVQQFDPDLILYGLAASQMASAAARAGLGFYHEGFADRRYTDQGQLVARNLPGAVIEDHQLALQQALQMAQQQQVISINGLTLPLHVDTICLHGDGAAARALAAALYQSLTEPDSVPLS